jgi:hypothetical protein
MIEYRASDGVKQYNALDYINGLTTLYGVLEIDEDFNADINQTTENITVEYIEGKSYYKRLNTIFEIIKEQHPLYRFYLNVEQFLMAVQTSTMTDEDKALFINEVIDTLLKDYIDFIRALDSGSIYNPLIPLLYTADSDGIELKKLNETKFRDCYDRMFRKGYFNH